MPLDPSLDQIFDAAGQQYNVDPALLRAVATQESRGDPQATSPAGAEGLMQLMPDTAKGLGVDPYDPAQAIYGGARYLAQGLTKAEQLKAQGQDVDPAQYALMYYHGGPNTDLWGPKTHAYVGQVASHYMPAAPAAAPPGAAPSGGLPVSGVPATPADPALSGLLRLASAGVSDIGPGGPAPQTADQYLAQARGQMDADLAPLAAAGNPGGPGAAGGPVPLPPPNPIGRETPSERLLAYQRARERLGQRLPRRKSRECRMMISSTASKAARSLSPHHSGLRSRERGRRRRPQRRRQSVSVPRATRKAMPRSACRR
jgi:hypothetical protein